MGRVNTGRERSDVPAELTAIIDTLYDTSLVNPVIVSGVVRPLMSYAMIPEGSVVYWYLNIGAPFSGGAVKSTIALAFHGVMVLMTGIPGALYIGMTNFGSDAGELPAGVPAIKEIL